MKKMEGNLILEQYCKYKKIALEKSPFRCLLNANIDINPHQIYAFCAAVKALKTGGIILADEVGLGKTIEAGLILEYVLNSGAKRVLIALPAALRKQWEIELEEKFSLCTTILDRQIVENDYYNWKTWLEDTYRARIVLTSYAYASKLIKRFPLVKWDFIIIDEAHNLRNVFRGTKRAKNLYELTKGIPKILLTATPLQNSLHDLHGLISFIDPRIFGNPEVFRKKFIDNQNYEGLRGELLPVLHRTLRKDVSKYMDFKKRECRTIDFKLSPDEIELYMHVNDFLKKRNSYSIPTTNKGLIILVIRKLLASSSYALVETFEVIKKRLKMLYQGTKSAKAQKGFDMFWEYIEDEIDESDFEDTDDEDIDLKKEKIQKEISEVDVIIKLATNIKNNAKILALKDAINVAFQYQENNNIPKKIVIFTESKRTQKYIANELRIEGFNEDDILLFNGDFDDSMTKEIYRAWQVKNHGNTNYGRNVEFKHAIVDYFKHNAKILLATDAGSEGLNLQFCNTVINYDLPWNPQKIEQRIGRCHRYGQLHDVVAINLLNTENEADQRVYDILSQKFELFNGVFGASDVALGALESGLSFEKTILEIYQSCNTHADFKKAFDKLDKKLSSQKKDKVSQLRSILLTEDSNTKKHLLEETRLTIDRYLFEVEYWSKFNEPEIGGNTFFWKIDQWGEEIFSSHGTLFLGAFCNSGELLFPVLLICDENGEYIDFVEENLVNALESADDSKIKYFTPSDKERILYEKTYDKLTAEMVQKYQNDTLPLIDYNKRKVENWIDIQIEQLNNQNNDLLEEIKRLSVEETNAKEFLRKVDIRKKIDEKKKHLQKQQDSFHKKVLQIHAEAEKDIELFNKKFYINPILLIDIVLKF